MADARDTIARLRSLHAAATPGPWRVEGDYGHTLHASGYIHAIAASYVGDAHFIAAMRNALPALLDVAEAARFLHEANSIDEQVAARDCLHIALDELAKAAP